MRRSVLALVLIQGVYLFSSMQALAQTSPPAAATAPLLTGSVGGNAAYVEAGTLSGGGTPLGLLFRIAGTEYMRLTSAGSVGIGTTTPTAGTILDLGNASAVSNSSVMLPKGTTANRPTTGVPGMLRYNTTLNAFEGYSGAAWAALASGGGISGYELVSNACSAWACRAQCSSGKKIVGGGCFINSYGSGEPAFALSDSYPESDSNWFCGVHSYQVPSSLTAYAMCAFVNTGTGTAGSLGSSAAATSPSRADDQTTGLFSAAPSTVSVATVGVERLSVTATGSVGIGTTNPASLVQLHFGTDKNIGFNTDTSGGTGYARISSYNDALSDSRPIYINGSYVGVQTNGAEVVRVTATGSVGIGTTAPTERLDLGGGTLAAGLEAVQNSCASCNSVSVACPAGKSALGGGCATSSTTLAFRGCTSNAASGIPTGWIATLANSASAYIEVRVICANIK